MSVSENIGNGMAVINGINTFNAVKKKYKESRNPESESSPMALRNLQDEQYRRAITAIEQEYAEMQKSASANFDQFRAARNTVARPFENAARVTSEFANKRIVDPAKKFDEKAWKDIQSDDVKTRAKGVGEVAAEAAVAAVPAIATTLLMRRHEKKKYKERLKKDPEAVENKFLPYLTGALVLGGTMVAAGRNKSFVDPIESIGHNFAANQDNIIGAAIGVDPSIRTIHSAVKTYRKESSKARDEITKTLRREEQNQYYNQQKAVSNWDKQQRDFETGKSSVPPTGPRPKEPTRPPLRQTEGGPQASRRKNLYDGFTGKTEKNAFDTTAIKNTMSKIGNKVPKFIARPTFNTQNFRNELAQDGGLKNIAKGAVVGSAIASIPALTVRAIQDKERKEREKEMERRYYARQQQAEHHAGFSDDGMEIVAAFKDESLSPEEKKERRKNIAKKVGLAAGAAAGTALFLNKTNVGNNIKSNFKVRLNQGKANIHNYFRPEKRRVHDFAPGVASTVGGLTKATGSMLGAMAANKAYDYVTNGPKKRRNDDYDDYDDYDYGGYYD